MEFCASLGFHESCLEIPPLHSFVVPVGMTEVRGTELGKRVVVSSQNRQMSRFSIGTKNPPEGGFFGGKCGIGRNIISFVLRGGLVFL